jgi:arylsulfatase A-like enzyme
LQGRVRGNKGFTDAAGTHIPFVASWPGMIEPRQVNDHLIDLTDFLPTLVEVAGAALRPEHVVDGLSFYPQLVGIEDTVRSWIFTDYDPRWGQFSSVRRRYVFDQHWKLYDDGSFFDIATDPGEHEPLAEGDLDLVGLQRRSIFRSVLERMSGEGRATEADD